MRPERIPPGPGQESVWDYPRPPRLEDAARHIQVIFAGTVIADSRRAKRVLETSHAPTYYLPPAALNAAWSYPHPTVPFAGIKDFIAVYPHEMDACLVDGERAEPQPGGFYGGWITPDVVGPFKGGPGSWGW